MEGRNWKLGGVGRGWSGKEAKREATQYRFPHPKGVLVDHDMDISLCDSKDTWVASKGWLGLSWFWPKPLGRLPAGTPNVFGFFVFFDIWQPHCTHHSLPCLLHHHDRQRTDDDGTVLWPVCVAKDNALISPSFHPPKQNTASLPLFTSTSMPLPPSFKPFGSDEKTYIAGEYVCGTQRNSVPRIQYRARLSLPPTHHTLTHPTQPNPTQPTLRRLVRQRRGRAGRAFSCLAIPLHGRRARQRSPCRLPDH